MIWQKSFALSLLTLIVIGAQGCSIFGTKPYVNPTPPPLDCRELLTQCPPLPITKSGEPGYIATQDDQIIKEYGMCALGKRQLVQCIIEYEKRIQGKKE
jgi:hypothetical protein